MITRFRVQNFKSLVDTQDVEFGPMNCIIGPNGCGKSSLLQAIDFLRAFFYTSVEVYLTEHGWDYADIPNLRKRNKLIRWDLDLRLPGIEAHHVEEFRYSVELSPRRYLGIGEESLAQKVTQDSNDYVDLLRRRGRRVELYNERTCQPEQINALRLPASVMASLGSPSDRQAYPTLLRFRDHVRSFRSFLLWDPKVLRQPSRGRRTELGPSGEHLASVLAYIRDNRPEDFARATKRIRRLFPNISDVSVRGARGWGWKEVQLHERNGNDVSFNSRQASDGVLRLLAIIALLYAEAPAPVLSLEEPENGVHPQLLSDVVQLLKELTLRKRPYSCQVFFTTHSPYVLDEFIENPEHVYVMERGRPQEGARISRLSTCTQIDLVRELFSRSLGEAWFSGVLGGTRGGRTIQ